jgi:hypothetical protein
MPYAATVVGPTINVIKGRAHYRWTVSETGAAPTDTWTITGAPAVGTVTLYRANLTAGTGVTINPRLGRTLAFTTTTNDVIGVSATTAALINDGTNLKYSGLTAGKIYGRSLPSNAAADHAVSTEIVVVEGMDV